MSLTSSSSQESTNLQWNSTTEVMLQYVEELCRALNDISIVFDLFAKTSASKADPEKKPESVSVGTQTDALLKRSQPLRLTCSKATQTRTRRTKCKVLHRCKQVLHLGHDLVSKADDQLLMLSFRAEQQKNEILYADRYLRGIAQYMKNAHVPCNVSCNVPGDEEMNQWQLLVAKERMLRQSWELGGRSTRDRMHRMARMYSKVFRRHCSSKQKQLQAFRLLELARLKNKQRTRCLRVLRSRVTRIERNYKVMLASLEKQVTATVDVLATMLDVAPQRGKRNRNASIQDHFNAVSSKLLWVHSCTIFFRSVITAGEMQQ